MADARIAVARLVRSEWGDFAEHQLPVIKSALAEEILGWINNESVRIGAFERLVEQDTRFEQLPKILEQIKANERLDDAQAEVVVASLYFSGMQAVLAKFGLLHPAYSIVDDYGENRAIATGVVPTVRPVAGDRRWSFIGRDIGFPIGVAASVLTASAARVQRLAQSGFNVITYKTVRSQGQPAWEHPNWVFLKEIENNEWDGEIARVSPFYLPPIGERSFSTANSFGIPSPEPAEWMSDFEAARSVLNEDQIIICSVVGEDYGDGNDPSLVIEDFVRTAKMASEAGAYAIELNLSSPNSITGSARSAPIKSICLDVALSKMIVTSVRRALPSDTAVGIKISLMSETALRELLTEVGHAVDWVSAINAVQLQTLHTDGSPVFAERPYAGVSGAAIFSRAIVFLDAIARVRSSLPHYFEIVGSGGVTDPDSFQCMYNTGASVVQAATGVYGNTLLAHDCVWRLGKTLPASPPVGSTAELSAEILASVRANAPASLWEVLLDCNFSQTDVENELAKLEEQGLIARIRPTNRRSRMQDLPGEFFTVSGASAGDLS